MKALSNIQNRVLSLSSTIPSLDEEYFQDLIYDVEESGRDFCSYNSSYVVDGQRLKSRFDELLDMFVLDSFKGWQVMRVFQLRAHLDSAGSWMSCRLIEVAQRWVNSNGDVVNMCRSYWKKSYGLFNQKSKMKIVESLPTFRQGNWCYNFSQFTIKKLSNIDYRWIKECVSFLDDRLAKFINSNVGEFFFKCGYKKLFNDIVLRNKKGIANSIEEIISFFNTIKVAHRHHYNFTKNLRLWLDMLTMIKGVDADLHNPKFVCPENLNKMHDMFVAKFNKKQEREEREREDKLFLENQERYHNAHKMYLGIVFSDEKNDLHFHVIQNANEMIEEGKMMHNCVGGYVTKDNSLILSCTDGKGNRISTIEILLDTLTISQNYGYCNTHPKFYNEIMSALNANMYLVKSAKQGNIACAA